MKGMKERLAKKIKLITIVSTLKQGLAHHRNNVDRTIHHLKEEIFAESGQNRGCVTPTLLELEEDVEEQEQEHDLQEEEREILLEFEENCPPGGEDSIVFYTTGLRGVRKTFEACRRVRFLLENHRVKYKERDVSMDSEFRDQMWRLLGAKVTSPRLFVRGRYIGGADEVVKWIEYTLKHGYDHLIPFYEFEIPWYQRWLLDVVFFYAVLATALVAAASFCAYVSYLCRRS